MTSRGRLTHSWGWSLAGYLTILGTILVSNTSAVAQILPDSTLGEESSTVTPNVLIRGIVSDRINGGAIRGANLFHSFEQFSINEGRGAYFSNPTGIDNIFSRVTGDRTSLTNGAQLDTSTFGQGSSGNIIVTARDTVSLDGTSADGARASTLFSEVVKGAVGNGGNVIVTTGSLFASNGARLQVNTKGEGNAGNVIINARDMVRFDGTSRDGRLLSGTLSNVVGNLMLVMMSLLKELALMENIAVLLLAV